MLPFFTTEKAGNHTVVDFLTPSLMNVIDLERVGQALLATVDDGARHVILDFGRVKYLSSQAIGIVLALNRRLNAEKGSLVLCGVSAGVMDLLRVTKLNKILHVASDRAKATKMLGG